MISNESFRPTSWLPLIVKMSCTTKNFSHKARIKLTDNKQPENETTPVWGASESEITERKQICLYCFLALCNQLEDHAAWPLCVTCDEDVKSFSLLPLLKSCSQKPNLFLLLSSFIFGRMQKKKKKERKMHCTTKVRFLALLCNFATEPGSVAN